MRCSNDYRDARRLDAGMALAAPAVSIAADGRRWLLSFVVSCAEDDGRL
jgi:hypothetical protein